ncbi:tetratricopeptide repeat protein [Inhella sp.]|uniref:tetratricopeptide repeat protein n=1 Tax=Inhella sp. TaxID=1921806 RepID=UPI0035B334B3
MTGFDASWLLLIIPAAFALGWLASRLDIRQGKRDPRDAAAPYFKGLNLLLNEQQDKAIDAFIEAVQLDPDTVELHFALGNLFRRRGETERAVRVHEHLLQRGDLPESERHRAQHALAQDFFKAGLFDRAEAAYLALKGSAYELDAELALLSLYERSRDWAHAAEVAAQLEQRDAGSFAPRRAHFLVEQALLAHDAGHADEAQALIDKAKHIAPAHPRAYVQDGRWKLEAGQHEAALQCFEVLANLRLSTFLLVADDYALAALGAGQAPAALARLKERYAEEPALSLLTSMKLLDPVGHAERLLAHLRLHPSLNAASGLLQPLLAAHALEVSAPLQRAVDAAAKPLLRHRCAACGFEALHYFWQCPGCLSWDSFPPRPVEEL